MCVVSAVHSAAALCAPFHHTAAARGIYSSACAARRARGCVRCDRPGSRAFDRRCHVDELHGQRAVGRAILPQVGGRCRRRHLRHRRRRQPRHRPLQRRLGDHRRRCATGLHPGGLRGGHASQHARTESCVRPTVCASVLECVLRVCVCASVLECVLRVCVCAFEGVRVSFATQGGSLDAQAHGVYSGVLTGYPQKVRACGCAHSGRSCGPSLRLKCVCAVTRSPTPSPTPPPTPAPTPPLTPAPTLTPARSPTLAPTTAVPAVAPSGA